MMNPWDLYQGTLRGNPDGVWFNSASDTFIHDECLVNAGDINEGVVIAVQAYAFDRQLTAYMDRCGIPPWVSEHVDPLTRLALGTPLKSVK
jgi:hypothetical protein